jgi:RNA polymerase sigma factor (sigma-70 family)
VASFVETQGHAGDEGNFEALYSTYRSEVQRLASYLLRNAADAEDASQTVFVNVLRALRQGVRPAEPRAWLLAITRNVCFSRGRAAAARPDEVELDPERLPEPGGDDTPSVDEIVGALSRMLPNQRAALILRDFRGAPHTEICELLTLSSAGAETLLARARASFREEIQAGEQPFDCAETKALVEQQLIGSITAAERHSLRTHLRHCSPCATLARAVRSSAGKVAGLVFWPGELLSRLGSALSQAPAAVHVAAAVTSAAAIATVAIPMAITHTTAANHVEGRVAPTAASATGARATLTQIAHAAGIAFVSHRAGAGSGTAGHAGTHGRTRGHGRAGSTKAVPSGSVKAASVQASRASSGGTPAQPGTTAPVLVSPRQSSPPAAATAPATARPTAGSPHSSSPAVRPGSKPKAKPKRAPRRGGGGRHPTDPADRMSGLQPGGAVSAPGDGGTDSGAGSGAVVGPSSSSTSPASTNSTTGSTSSRGNQDGAASGSNSGGSNGNGSNGDGSGGRGSGDGGHHKPKR